MENYTTAIVAAMEREVRPLVKDWPTVSRQHDGRTFRFFEKSPVVLVCGGIGSEAARRAAEAGINLYHPRTIISAGFAGGLDPSLKVGDKLMPRQIVDFRDGSRTDVGSGAGVLVTVNEVAGVEQKVKLADAYGAQAVDMEAAAVARSAEAHGTKFLACKVISDAHDSSLPPVARFMRNGSFDTGGFIAYVAVRPWLWGGVTALARNSRFAAKALSEMLIDPKLWAAHMDCGSVPNELSFHP
jgi:adenosylhomocysteine nucleosidase